MTRRLYVFDLDGTLADTTRLPEGRRSPAMLLNTDPFDPGLDLDPWAYVNDEGVRVASLVGFLESIGHRVAIITRSPRSYASTLCGLLDIESTLVWPSTETDRSDKLLKLAELAQVDPADSLYVGDEEGDAQAAYRAGFDFEWAQTIGNEFYLAEDLPELKHSPRNVAEAARSLFENPQHEREELQHYLANKVRPEHRFCLIPADRTNPLSRGHFRYVGVRPALFTRDERGDEYFTLLRNLFPKLAAPEVHPSVAENYYFVSYRKMNSREEDHDPLGDLMRRIKDYTSTSGPNVELGSLPFVAHVMAAHLAQRFARVENVHIDHVAPHPYSVERPGQVSSWLCWWAMSVASGIVEGESPHHEWMAWRSTPRDTPAPRHPVARKFMPGLGALLDDQRTRGTQLRQHIERSPLEYFLTMTWSFSQAPRRTGPKQEHRRSSAHCYWPDRGPCPRHGPSEFLRG